jgi:hypothetical protein
MYVYTGRLLAATVLVCMVSTTWGYTYPFSFFNISTDKKDVGFVQVFTCSAKQANIRFQVRLSRTRRQLPTTSFGI